MPDTLRWGILGTGNIARQFCAGVATSRRTRLAAVGSRSGQSAEAFAHATGIPTAHGSYDSLINDDGVDAIYVSLPNSAHHEWTLKALRAGKHVLCEKPLAATSAQAREMFDAADRANRALVEAFMYRAHPLTLAVLDTLRSGAIGELRLIRTSFCYRTRRVEGNIRFDPRLAGGALMDVGCYCTSFALMLASSEPMLAHATGRLHPTGVDELAAGTLTFPSGLISTFACGMDLQADNSAYLCGTEGYIEIPIPWKPPRHATYTIGRGIPPKMDGGPAAQTHPPRDSRVVHTDQDLYAIEADAFAASVLDGKPAFMPRHESLANMRLLDELRRQVGVQF